MKKISLFILIILGVSCSPKEQNLIQDYIDSEYISGEVVSIIDEGFVTSKDSLSFYNSKFLSITDNDRYAPEYVKGGIDSVMVWYDLRDDWIEKMDLDFDSLDSFSKKMLLDMKREKPKMDSDRVILKHIKGKIEKYSSGDLSNLGKKVKAKIKLEGKAIPKDVDFFIDLENSYAHPIRPE